MPDPLEATHRTSAFRGAFLTIGMRWTDRLLGLVNTLVLARLLVPEDFGLVAMAMVIVGLLDVMLDLGVSAALIQNDRAEEEDFHTAWTLRLTQSVVAAVLLVASAPAASTYYGDPRVVAILQVIAVTVFVGGLENIGTVSFQRNMEFGRDFQFFFLKKLVAVVFTIGVALALRSYWALVLGSLVSRMAGVGLSYWMSAFRPRLSFARFARIWAFSQWNLFANVGRYLNAAIPRFVIGGRDDAAALGAYTVGEEIASMPTSELLAPLGRVMFPVFSAAKHDASELLRVAGLAQSVQALIAIPASVGVALVANDAIPILLGEKWRVAVPVTQILAFAGVATALGHSGGYLLTALGRMKTLSLIVWGRVVLLLVLLLAVFADAGIEGAATASLLASIAALAMMQSVANRVLPGFGGWAMLRQTWRPLVAASAMAAAVLGVAHLLADGAPLARLLAEVATGAGAYSLGVLLLWRASGSPPGAETYILEKFNRRRAPT